jgi:hypothetical protein
MFAESDTNVAINEISQIDDILELENFENNLNEKKKFNKDLHMFIQLRRYFILLEEFFEDIWANQIVK